MPFKPTGKVGFITCVMLVIVYIISQSNNSTYVLQPLGDAAKRLHLMSQASQSQSDASKNVRVIIWVMTAPKNHEKKARFVQKSWAKRADKVLFISDVTNSSFPTIGCNCTAGYRYLMEKTVSAFRYLYNHYLNDYDWFMKVDDDTYVVYENLKHFLSTKNTSEPIHYGKLFNYDVKQGYYSGGGGYILSKEALTRLVTRGNDSKVCKQRTIYEDLEIGRCMEKLGVRTENSVDSKGRTLFHCFSHKLHLYGPMPKWWPKRDSNHGHIGRGNISNSAITFHNIIGREMETLDFFIYHIKPFGK